MCILLTFKVRIPSLHVSSRTRWMEEYPLKSLTLISATARCPGDDWVKRSNRIDVHTAANG